MTILEAHQEVSPLDGSQHGGVALDEETREHRRRVWWSVYSLDRILCVKSGNPITVQDEDIIMSKSSLRWTLSQPSNPFSRAPIS